MTMLDVRTRTSADVRDVSTPAFFDDELPALIASRAELAVPGARELGVAPFCVATKDGAWTLALAGDTITVGRGDTGDARVELDDDEIAKLVNDLITPMTLVASASPLQSPV